MKRMKISSTEFARRCTLRVALLFVCASLGVWVSQGSGMVGRPISQGDSEVKVTTVFLVRHAEKADVPGQDPPLSEAGRQRAEALARLLQSAGVKGIYTSQFLRTRQTAEPLARQIGVTPGAIPLGVKTSNPREVSDESIRELTKKVEAHAGDAVLIVGHSNSIPEVIRMLGGDTVPKINESRFDDLFIVTVYAGGRAKVTHLKYGRTD